MTRAMRDLYLTYARRRAVFGSASFALPSRFLAEIPPDLIDSEGAPPAFGGGFGGGGRPAPGSRIPGWAASRTDAPTADYRLGDDVVHTAFGEGVVTGVEPGGIVVVRFASDGSERKLMAEYAPISKR
jgi:DNA helicase-2/ATP-dependent DNA helicase PcrA